MAFTGFIQLAQANPEGGNITVGSGSITQSGDTLSVITGSHRTVIDWNAFSIGAGEITRITQPTANSATLNRVVGGMPSTILGTLVSNGHVALINENGILVGAGGVIDTHGFTGSTLDVSNDAFLSGGSLTFTGSSNATVVNKGAILAREGDVFLLGHNVENSGVITADNGNVGLAAGGEIVLRKASDEHVYVEVKSSSRGNSVVNAGTIKALQGDLRDNGGNPYKYAMNTGKAPAVGGYEIRKGGGVYLTAGNAGSVTHSGAIKAAKGKKGGEVAITGRNVLLKSGSTTDASGAKGGGSVKVGGGFHGKDASVDNAERTFVEAGASIHADATVDGKGGSIVVWADGTTTYQGLISAKGAGSGAGGNVEVSGKGLLNFLGEVDLTSASGAKGELLLDPTSIIIQVLSPDINGPFLPGASDINSAGDLDNAITDFPNANSVITTGRVSTLLASSNLTLAATDTILQTSPITWSSGFGLTMSAGNQLTITASIINSGTGGISITGTNVVDLNASVGTQGLVSITGAAISSNSSISGNGVTLTGNVTLDGSGNQQISAGSGTLGVTGSLTKSTADLTLLGTGVSVGGAFTGNNVTINASTGNITASNAGNNFTSLNLTGAAVTIVENSATSLAGVNATSLSLTSAGAITDTTGATISVANNASFSAGSNAVTLGDTATDVTNFGSLTFKAGNVSISEDSATVLSGANTANFLSLVSSGSITDTAGTALGLTSGGIIRSATSTILDDTAITNTTTGDVVFRSGNGGDVIINNLGNNFNGAAGNVYFEATSGTLANVDVYDSTNFGILPITVTGNLTVGSGFSLIDGGNISVGGNASFRGTAITIGGADRTTNFGTLTVNSVNSACVIQEDSDTVFAGTSHVGSMELTSSGSISNAAGMNLSVSFQSYFTASGSIVLSNHAGDILGTNSDTLFSGSSIAIGGAGTANFGSLTFTSAGAVNIQENSATALTRTSNAGSLVLSSAGAITESAYLPGNSIGLVVNGDATLAATNGITLNNITGDVLTISGKASFSGTSVAVGGAAGGSNFGTLNFTSAGAVTIQEDSATSLAGTNTAGSLSLSSSGAITSAASTSVTVTNGASFTAAGAAITLNDNAADVLSVGATATFNGSAVMVGSAGSANFGALTFTSSGVVTIQEDSPTVLTGANTAGSLSLASSGAITDAASASVIVTNGASFTAVGASITLNDNAADVLSVGANAIFNGSAITVGSAGSANFGTLTFVSPGAVTIQEDSATTLTGANTAGSLSLTSTGTIADGTAATLGVTGLAGITSGNSIVLDDITFTVGGNTTFTAGNGGSVLVNHSGNNFTGSVTFAAVSGTLANVDVLDVSDLDLRALSVTGNLTAVSGGALTDSGDLSVGGRAWFSGSSVTIGGPAENSNFGSLSFNSSGSVTIREDSSADLAGANTAGSLLLVSGGAITDGAGATLNVTGAAAITSVNSITLDDSLISVGGDTAFTAGSGASITANQAGNSFTGAVAFIGSSGILANVEILDTTDLDLQALWVTGDLKATSGGALTDSGDLTIGGRAAFTGSSVTIGSGVRVSNFGTLAFSSGGAVTIQEDSATELAGVNTAGSLSLTSSGAITDAASTRVIVTNGASFAASGASITLNDNAADVLSVGGSAAFNGSAITVGSAGSANFGTLTFISPGAVTIQEDSATTLAGANTAGSLSLVSDGTITDAAGTTLDVSGTAAVTSSDSITLDDGTLAIGGNTAFTAGSGRNIIVNRAGNHFTGSVTFAAVSGTLANVDILDATDLDLQALSVTGNLTAVSGGALTDSGDLSVGGRAGFAGNTVTIGGSARSSNFGTLSFASGGAVTIQEDSATTLSGVNTAGSLSLTSSGALTDAAATSVIVANDAAFTATGAAITLNDNAADVLDVGGHAAFNGSAITVGSAGMANFGTLTFNSAGAVEIQEDSATNLTETSTAGSLSLVSTGDIMQAGAVAVRGDAIFDAGGNILLNHTANSFVRLNVAHAQNVGIRDSDNGVTLFGANHFSGSYFTLVTRSPLNPPAGTSPNVLQFAPNTSIVGTAAGNRVHLIAGETGGRSGLNEIRGLGNLAIPSSDYYIYANSLAPNGSNISGAGAPGKINFGFHFGPTTVEDLLTGSSVPGSSINAIPGGGVVNFFAATPVVILNGPDLSGILDLLFEDFDEINHSSFAAPRAGSARGKRSRGALSHNRYGPFAVSCYEHAWWEQKYDVGSSEEERLFKGRYPLYLYQAGVDAAGRPAYKSILRGE